MNLAAAQDVHEALYEFVQLVELGIAAVRQIAAEADTRLPWDVFGKLDEVELSTQQLRILCQRHALIAVVAAH